VEEHGVQKQRVLNQKCDDQQAARDPGIPRILAVKKYMKNLLCIPMCLQSSPNNLKFTAKPLQLNMYTDINDVFRAAQQSAAHNLRGNRVMAPINTPTTKVQWLENGIMHTINLPFASTPREIERFQEYAQNTALGTIHVLKHRGSHINSALRNYCTEFNKIRGGVFDGLSRQEIEFLQEKGWTPEYPFLHIDAFQSFVRPLPEPSMQPAARVADRVCPLGAGGRVDKAPARVNRFRVGIQEIDRRLEQLYPERSVVSEGIFADGRKHR
jgi:hypothetical protein